MAFRTPQDPHYAMLHCNPLWGFLNVGLFSGKTGHSAARTMPDRATDATRRGVCGDLDNSLRDRERGKDSPLLATETVCPVRRQLGKLDRSGRDHWKLRWTQVDVSDSRQALFPPGRDCLARIVDKAHFGLCVRCRLSTGGLAPGPGLTERLLIPWNAFVAQADFIINVGLVGRERATDLLSRREVLRVPCVEARVAAQS